MTSKKHLFRKGFTLIELLVVIAIIGLLGTVTFTGARSWIRSGKAHNAREVCDQIKTAFTKLHDDLGFWPDDINSSGTQEMDPDVCAILGSMKLLDVQYIDSQNSSNTASGLKSNKDNSSQLKVGLLSPLGEDRFKAGRSNSNLKDYLYQFVIDRDENGIVDSSDGLPSGLGVSKVSGSAAVWCWDDDGETIFAKSW